MSKTIIQKVVFKNATAKDLYDLYMDEKKHSMATAVPARISRKVGGRYSVHNGYITGKNLHLVKDKLIVQTWRAQDWERKRFGFYVHTLNGAERKRCCTASSPCQCAG